MQKGVSSLWLIFGLVLISTGIIFFYINSKNMSERQVLQQKDQKPFLAPRLVEKVKPTEKPADFNIGVLVLKYFPLTSNGNNIDEKITGDVSESYQSIRQNTIDVTTNLKNSIEKASKSSLRYKIIDTKEYTQAIPIKPRPDSVRYPDYRGILEKINICDYVENKGVKEVWLWAYQGPNKQDDQPFLGIAESKMSGSFGDISNSARYNDLPACKNTYRVYTFNYGRGTSEAFESWGHQMEAELSEMDQHLFRGLFQGSNYPQTLGVTGRCGSVHNPPNARFEYDRANSTPNKSDCLDWNPDGLGKLSDISCQNWGCEDRGDDDNPSLNYMIWMWKNLPNKDNQIYYKGKKLRNFWEVHVDFDQAVRDGKRLTET